MTLILSGTNGLSDVDGSAATPAIRGTDANTGIFFPAADTIAFSEGGVEAMRIDSSANVGIGTSSPSAQLDVSRSSTSGYSTFRLSNSGASGKTYEIGVGGNAAAAGYANNLYFYDSTASAIRMVLDTSGNLLVGTATASAYGMKLKVVGGIESTNTVQFNIVGSAATPFEWVLRTGSGMDFYVNNAATKASLTSSGVWTNASDERYKENIKPIEYGISEVMQLHPRSYNMIGSDKQEIGFVAQEVQPFLPELVENSVNSITNEERMTLSYGQLSAVLVKAIQEQQAIITQLQADVAALKAR